jgi:hypothetical protein
MTWRCLPVLVLVLAGAAPAAAQPLTTLSPAKDGKLENLVPVPAADACWAAVSETLGLLAFCHERTREDAQVSLVRLNARGRPAAYSTTWKLPRPAAPALAKVPHYALSAAFHPKLPLLYVWQDIAVPYPNAAPPPEVKLFDHLCVYNVAKSPPELVVALCRGENVAHGQSGGGLAVDAPGEFLYVPNLLEKGFMKLGRFPLDADGLLLLDEKDAKLPLPTRVKKLADLNLAKGVTPAQVPPTEYQYLFPSSNTGTGTGFLPLSKDVVICAGYNGLMTWRPNDKDCTLHGLPLKFVGTALFTSHPALPYLFATGSGTDSVHRVGHADGFLTLLPRQFRLPDTELTSQPAIVAGGKKLVVGGHYHLYVVNLDDRGLPLPEVVRVRVLNPRVRAVVYSRRFERLYVGVEPSK